MERRPSWRCFVVVFLLRWKRRAQDVAACIGTTAARRPGLAFLQIGGLRALRKAIGFVEAFCVVSAVAADLQASRRGRWQGKRIPAVE